MDEQWTGRQEGLFHPGPTLSGDGMAMIAGHPPGRLPTQRQRRRHRRSRALSDTNVSPAARSLNRAPSERGRASKDGRSRRRSSSTPCKPMGTWKATDLPKILAATGTRPEQWFVATENGDESEDGNCNPIGTLSAAASATSLNDKSPGRESGFPEAQALAARPSTAPGGTSVSARHQGDNNSFWQEALLEEGACGERPASGGAVPASSRGYSQPSPLEPASPRVLFEECDFQDIWDGEENMESPFELSQASSMSLAAQPDSAPLMDQPWGALAALSFSEAAVRRDSIFDLDPAACLLAHGGRRASQDTFTDFLEALDASASHTSLAGGEAHGTAVDPILPLFADGGFAL